MSDLIVAVAIASGLLLGASVLLLYLRGTAAGKSEPLKEATAIDERPVVRICYGTQTGTAEKFSKQLAGKLAEGYGDAVRFEVTDMEVHEYEKMGADKMTIFLAATYGDGEPTDNAMTFYNWLLKSSEDVMNGDLPEPCKGMPYAVFGLGNKQYEHFNAVGKAIHKHLEVLGGSALTAVGLGDDDADIADDFEVWTDKLLRAIEAGEVLGQAQAARDHAPLQGYAVTVTQPGAAASAPLAAPWRNASSAGHSVTLASVGAVRELHGAASERSCIHVEVDISGTGVKYEHGDHVAVFPQNSCETVAEAARLLRADLDSVIALALPPDNPERLNEPFPCPTTLRAALSQHAALLHHPDKHALEALASCATDEVEAAKLRTLASHDGKAEFASYVVAAQRSLLQVMADFPSCQPSLGLFFAHIAPRLQPRYYSISSSPLLHPQSVHITAAVVDEVGPSGRRHLGVASNWLATRRPGEQVPMFVRRSTFKLPKQMSTPVIMVGPGTGLAPFRGFLQHRAALRQCGEELGSAALFFGCRHPDKDYIYQEELQAHHQDKTLAALHVAFSRLADKKDYVQHHLLQQGEAVHKQLLQAAVFYVCGDAKHMAKDVHRALHEVIRTWAPCSVAEAEAMVKEMQKAGRYFQDVW